MNGDNRTMTFVSMLIGAFVAFSAPDTAASSMLTQAQQYSGMHEVKNNRKLRATLGINPARTPWCGYFMGLVVRKAGRKPPQRYTFARAWTTFGAPVSIDHARPGDVVVIRTRRNYHVGILSGLGKQWVRLLGGNQSNRVQHSQYSRRSIVAIRR